MATAPITPEDIKNAPEIIKIPNTLIMDKDGTMAREWVYFFNDISRAVDQQITANLPELTQKLLDSVAEIIRLDNDAELTNVELAYAINDIANNRVDIDGNTNTIAANRADIDGNIAILTGQAISISNLNTALNAETSKVAALQTKTSNQAIEILSLDSRLQSAENTATNQADAIAALINRVVALETAP